MQEIWLPIPDCLNLYEASNFGRIRSVARHTTPGRVLRPQLTGRRYPSVSISVEGRIRTRAVHRLVGITFLPNPLRHPELNHIDGNKSNSAPGNLEWCAPKHNMEHAVRTGLKPPVLGVRHGRAVLSEADVLEIRDLRERNVPGIEVARLFRVTPTTVSSIHRRHTWQHI